MGGSPSAGDFFGAIRDGFVDLGNNIKQGGEEALKALDKPARDRAMRERQEAADMIRALDMKQKFDQEQVKRDIEKQAKDETADFVNRAQAFKIQYTTLASQITDLMNSWHDQGLKAYDDMVEELSNGLGQLGVVAFVLHGLTIEQIRDAKLKNITFPKTPISIGSVRVDVDEDLAFTTAILHAQTLIKTAAAGSSQLIKLTADVLSKLADITKVQIVRLGHDMDIFAPSTQTLINGLVDSMTADQNAMDELSSQRNGVQTELLAHFDINAGDDAINIVEMPLSLFIHPDDGWRQFVQDHENIIAQKNLLINEHLKTFRVAELKLNVLKPLLQEISDLTRSTAAMANKAAAVQTTAIDVDAKANQLLISVGELSDSFDHLDDPTKKLLSTADFVVRIADAGTHALSVDFPRMQKLSAALLQALQMIPIPGTAAGASRGETPESAIAALKKALVSPKQALLPAMFEVANPA